MSDSGGRVDFGVVQPGDWSFELSTSWDEEHSWTCRGTINVKLGTEVYETIICPRPAAIWFILRSNFAFHGRQILLTRTY